MTVEVGAVYGGPAKRAYYNVYGERFLLPSDPWSLQQYTNRGLTLTPPVAPPPDPKIDLAEEFVGLTPEPPGIPKKQKTGEISEDTVLAVVKAMEKAGYSFVKTDEEQDTADTPPESDTKLIVSQVSDTPPKQGVLC